MQWFDCYQAHGRNAALTCRYFGISRQTFYRWKRRYDPEQLSTLEDHSHRPRRRRHPTWAADRIGRRICNGRRSPTVRRRTSGSGRDVVSNPRVHRRDLRTSGGRDVLSYLWQRSERGRCLLPFLRATAFRR
ncbi:MAG: helix-turn-helix domain-containing protein [Terriglobia bacterium]